MTTYSYPIAKDLLTEVEKDRIVCTYLNSTEPNAARQNPSPCHGKVLTATQVDWDKATADYGAASVSSYKKGMQNTIKKLKTAMDSGVQPDTAEATPAKKGGKKRKVDGEGEVEETSKKKGRKSKAQKEAKAATAADAEGDDVKEEQED